MKCDFSFKHYDECLSLIHGGVELIHDLDYPPHNIVDMARLEQRHGLQATYFIRFHARFYNPFCLEFITKLREVADMGHHLGLHFEPRFYEDPTNGISIESTALKELLNRPIKAVSLHETAKFGTLDRNAVPWRLDYYCYTAPHYDGKKYISDSGGRWREGCMCEHIGKHNQLIILTHPNWWWHTTTAENY